MAAVLACAVFAAISGSSPATVIAIGTIMFPMLIKSGYDEKFSLGLLSTSGSLGIIIPPSVPMIVFAVIVSNPSGKVGIVSPTDLFFGGVVPGLFIAMALVAYTFYVNWPRKLVGHAAGPGAITAPSEPYIPPPEGNYFADLGMATLKAVPSLFLPVLILGGIWDWFSIIGIPLHFDVTQAAAVAVVYALAVELLVHPFAEFVWAGLHNPKDGSEPVGRMLESLGDRDMRFRDVPGVCVETAVMIGSLFLILVIAIALNQLMVDTRLPELATEWMQSLATNPVVFLLLVTVFLLILGCLMDIISAILIVAPLLTPIAAEYGIHPIYFGIIFIVNLELGYLTPPLGINLFVASITFERPILTVIRSVIPFLLVMLFCLFTIVWVPYLLERGLGVQVPGLPTVLETADAEAPP